MHSPDLSVIPLIRVVIPFICGIILYTIFEYSLDPLSSIILISIATIAGIIYYFKLRDRYHLRWFFGVNVNFAFLVAGYLLAQSHDHRNGRQHFSNLGNYGEMLRLQINRPISEKTNSFQVVARVTHVIANQKAIETKGNLMLFLAKDSLAASLQYGDVIIIDNAVQQIAPPQNPNAFNFQRFLSRQNIFHQTYRNSGMWYKSSQTEGNIIISVSNQLRFKAIELLQRNNLEGEEFAVVSALFLGYSEHLTEDLQKEYAGAGAMHILSVSGLHVGIIYVSLCFIFGFLSKIKHGGHIRLFLILGIIWFYAALTGFSPSVLRATAMFSFVAIGQGISRSTNIYNSLAASALVLTLIDPMIITRIGFQLSYIAVISIVAIHPLIYNRVIFPNKVANYFWATVTVSIAAQVGTGPLAMYYFNQFPNYFLLANLIVVPLSGLIMNIGIIFFMVAPIGALAALVGEALSISVWLLNASVQLVEGLPYSTTADIHISQFENLLIYGLIATTLVFISGADKRMFKSAIFLLFLLTFSISARTIKTINQDKIIVYNVPNATAIDFISGKSCYFMACSNILENPRKIRLNIHEYRVTSGTPEPYLIKEINNLSDFIPFTSSRLAMIGPFIQHQNSRIMVAADLYIAEDFYPSQDTLNLLIITDNVKQSFGEIANNLPADKIVIDSSVGYKKATEMLQTCEVMGLKCWSVRHHGAFEYRVE